MPHQLHLALTFISEFAGFMIGAAFGIWMWVARPIDWPAVVLIVLFGGAIVVGVMLPRILFRRLIPARCPAEGCDGAAFPEGRKPIVYRCRRCGHIHDTGWSETSSTHHHRP